MRTRLHLGLGVVVLLGCGSGATPAKPASDPTASTSSTTAAGGGPIDTSVVPAGTGWWCFNLESGFLSCKRSVAECKTEKSKFFSDPDETTNPCAAYQSVFAFTMRSDQAGEKPNFFPYPSMAECEGEAHGRGAPGWNAKTVGSKCTEVK